MKNEEETTIADSILEDAFEDEYEEEAYMCMCEEDPHWCPVHDFGM